MSDTGVRKVNGYCGLCIARCGSVATVENGRFIRLDPDPSHPTGQALCAKGRAAPELVYHKDRLTQPLRRTRPKGDADPGWVPISWDEALNSTADAVRRIRNTIRAACRRIQPILTFDDGNCGFGPLCAPADECVRHSKYGLAARSLWVGPRVRHAVCLRRRKRGHKRRWSHAGHLAHWVPDLVGL